MTFRPSPRVLRVADQLRRVVWRVAGPRTIGIRGMVVDDEGRILLVRHSYGPRLWHLPGGGVKRRESLLDGLRRELREEVGVVFDDMPQLHGTFSNLTEGKSDHISVFVVTSWRREATASSEIANVDFFAADGLPDEVSPGTRRRIEEWVSGAGHSSYTW